MRYAALLLAAAALAMIALAPSVGAQSARKYTAPRTPDGQPDLQGYWTNASYTPLERPAELGLKEFYTEEEARAVEQARRLREANQPANDIHYDDALWQTENYSKSLSNRRTSIVFDPPNGRLPPLTAAGEKRALEVAEAARRRTAAASAQDRSLAERCISWGAEGPPMIGSTYNANLQIIQTPQAILIYSEMVHGARVVWIDGRTHLPASIRQLGGDSIGRWEGETLVVDSSNFTDLTNFRGPPATTRQDIFSSRDLHVVERFTRIDPETILYRFTVEDPTTWVQPWSGELLMRRFEGPLYEYACHEGNYGLANILAGARAEEARAAAR
jgi:hypothetical protein